MSTRAAGLHHPKPGLAPAGSLTRFFDRWIFVLMAVWFIAVAPMFIWDVLRTRRIHKAYSIWLAGFLPSSVLIYLLWNTDWWQATAAWLVGL
jgi:hypothetical protein